MPLVSSCNVPISCSQCFTESFILPRPRVFLSQHNRHAGRRHCRWAEAHRVHVCGNSARHVERLPRTCLLPLTGMNLCHGKLTLPSCFYIFLLVCYVDLPGMCRYEGSRPAEVAILDLMRACDTEMVCARRYRLHGFSKRIDSLGYCWYLVTLDRLLTRQETPPIILSLFVCCRGDIACPRRARKYLSCVNSRHCHADCT
jgi:hypothetical protein